MVCSRRATSTTSLKPMTDIALNLEHLKQVSGGATNHDFCVDPLVLIWKLNNPGKDLPKWLGGKKDPSSKF